MAFLRSMFFTLNEKKKHPGITLNFKSVQINLFGAGVPQKSTPPLP